MMEYARKYFQLEAPSLFRLQEIINLNESILMRLQIIGFDAWRRY
jgi:hypothetical protein